MKAISIDAYGPPEVLKLVEMPMPKIKANEVLVKNVVASINPYDWMVRNGSMWFMAGFKFPKILGGETAGVVAEVGHAVKEFRVRDRVIVFLGRAGGYAEYVAVSESKVIALPNGVSFRYGAALPIAATTALDALYELGKIKRGDHVLINGAYGSVGSFAVQLAKEVGAHVTAVCSGVNFDGVKQLGADEVIDYTKTNFTENGKKYDLIFDTPSVLKFSDTKKSLKENGILINTLPSPLGMINMALNAVRKQKFKIIFADPTKLKIVKLVQWVSEGKLKVVIDREYPLDKMAEAHHHSETKHAKGKIIVNF